MNGTTNFEDNFFVQFLCLSYQNFPIKVSNTDYIMPGFDNHFFSKTLFCGLRVNCSVNIGIFIYIYLVAITVSFNVKPLKKCMYLSY